MEPIDFWMVVAYDEEGEWFSVYIGDDREHCERYIEARVRSGAFQRNFGICSARFVDPPRRAMRGQ